MTSHSYKNGNFPFARIKKRRPRLHHDWRQLSNEEGVSEGNSPKSKTQKKKISPDLGTKKVVQPNDSIKMLVGDSLEGLHEGGFPEMKTFQRSRAFRSTDRKNVQKKKQQQG